MSDDQSRRNDHQPQPEEEQLTPVQPATATWATQQQWRPPAEELAAELAPRRSGRQVAALTAALATVVVAVVAFAAGVLVQRHHGATTSVAATAQARTFGGGAGAAGRFADGGGQGRGFAPVTGTVVSAGSGRMVVKKTDGSTVTVTVPDGVTVTKSTSEPLSSLAKGSMVSVLGSTGSDGAMTARTVVEGPLGAGFGRGAGPARTAAPTTGG